MNSNALLAVSLVLVLIASDARPAERTLDSPYEITLFRRGADYQADRPTFETVAGPFESREACRIAITRVRVLASGVRLVCTAIETARVR